MDIAVRTGKYARFRLARERTAIDGMTRISAWPGAKAPAVVVTGAAAGVGAECARALARRGARVAVVDIDKVPLARLAIEIGAHAFACDVISEHSVGEFIRQLFAELPDADLLINAAGADYVRSLGMMRVSRAFAAATAAAGRQATIYNVACAERARQSGFEYAGSRHAFSRLSEGLGTTLAGLGAKVVTLGRLDRPDEVADLIAQLVPTAPSAGTSARRRRAAG